MNFLRFMHQIQISANLDLRKINDDVKTKYLRNIFINTTDTAFFEEEEVF